MDKNVVMKNLATEFKLMCAKLAVMSFALLATVGIIVVDNKIRTKDNAKSDTNTNHRCKGNRSGK